MTIPSGNHHYLPASPWVRGRKNHLRTGCPRNTGHPHDVPGHTDGPGIFSKPGRRSPRLKSPGHGEPSQGSPDGTRGPPASHRNPGPSPSFTRTASAGSSTLHSKSSSASTTPPTTGCAEANASLRNNRPRRHPEGAIFDLAESCGLRLRGIGPKRTLACPLPEHTDRTASAVLFANHNRFYCSVCTPGSSLSLEEFAAALGTSLDLQTFSTRTPLHDVPSTVTPANEKANVTPTPTFTPEMAQEVWQQALARARDDARCSDPEDKRVYEYLSRRRLMEAWERCAFGLVTTDMDLPESVRQWPARGYHVVVPLFDAQTGELTNVQSRSIHDDAKPKTLFPARSQATGAVFADSRALEALRGERVGEPVLIGEGLTDFLALSSYSPVPVICAPGTAGVLQTIGAWCRGRLVFLAIDCDAAGERVVDEASREVFRRRGQEVVRVNWQGDAKDACDVLAKVGREGFATLLEEFIGC